MHQNSPRMTSSCFKASQIITIFVGFLLLASVSPAHSAGPVPANNTFWPHEELTKLKITALLKRLNKPSVKTIQSPDGDLIDCVPSHLQPAFDHPRLKGQKPLDPPEMPKGLNPNNSMMDASFQLWTISGESCPEGTVPIRRTTEEDVVRANSISRFGRKPAAARVRHDFTGFGHEHAVEYVTGGEYYGAKASINVWTPRVASPSEFSLAQIWVTAGTFGKDMNTIEAGWQVFPQLYGDYRSRFFIYWTRDAYQATGCYNLLCSGFVQTHHNFAMGATMWPVSAYNGRQFDFTLLIWKDPKHGNWWLRYGSGLLLGYWPSFLFNHLARHASMVEFGGEIFNSRPSGFHTSTQMGSGHFAGEQFRKAAYFRNMQVVDWDNSLVPLLNLRILPEHPGCYDIKGGIGRFWGNFFYYGGPGRNMKCY